MNKNRLLSLLFTILLSLSSCKAPDPSSKETIRLKVNVSNTAQLITDEIEIEILFSNSESRERLYYEFETRGEKTILIPRGKYDISARVYSVSGDDFLSDPIFLNATKGDEVDLSLNLRNVSSIVSLPADNTIITVESGIELFVHSSAGTVFYTTDGSAPNSSSYRYQGSPIYMYGSDDSLQTLRVMFLRGDWEFHQHEDYTFQYLDIGALEFERSDGAILSDGIVFSQTFDVYVNTSTSNASVYYSLNSLPYLLYSSPITVSGEGEHSLETYATLPYYHNETIQRSYIINYEATLSPPTFNISSDTYTSDQSLIIYPSTSDSDLYYSLDGSTPSILYTSPIPLTGNNSYRIKAFERKLGLDDSSTIILPVTIDYEDLVLTLSENIFDSTEIININVSQPGSTIHYSWTDPTVQSDVFTTTGLISLPASGDHTLYSYATQNGFDDSSILVSPIQVCHYPYCVKGLSIEDVLIDNSSDQFITSELLFPATLDFGVDITWETSKIAVISDWGTVNRPNMFNTAIDVYVTADILRDSIPLTREYKFTVQPMVSAAVSLGNTVCFKNYCWGENGNRLLRTGDTVDLGGNSGDMMNLTPLDYDSDKNPIIMRGGASVFCVQFDDGNAECWGDNGHGQLGHGGSAPYLVNIGTGRTIHSISPGGYHTCAILDDKSTKCFGNNDFGQLGYGDNLSRGGNSSTLGDNLFPVDLGTGRYAKAIYSGFLHTCAKLDNNQLKCWGRSDTNQTGVGYGNFGDDDDEMGDFLPYVNFGEGRTVKSMSSGQDHNCAVLDNNSVKCFGASGGGALGAGSDGVDFGLNRYATQVAVGRAYSCALLDNSEVKCWGGDGFGQLGNGSAGSPGSNPANYGDNLLPIEFPSGKKAIAIASGEYFNCVTFSDLTLSCWGNNSSGQLGQENFDNRGDDDDEMGDFMSIIDF